MEESHLPRFPEINVRLHYSIFQDRVFYLNPIGPHIYPHLGNNRFPFPEEGHLLVILNE